MPLIPYVDLTEIALFRNSDERSEHRDFIIRFADWGQDESSADRRLSGFQGGFNPVRRLVVKKSITDERSISRY
jgi:hypothetical protein